jgi:cytosine/adenosine deaminase-related metal-dependent hydrolase
MPPPNPSAEPLLPKPLVVRGHMVTFSRPAEIPDGVMYVDRKGRIVAVQDAAKTPPPAFVNVEVNVVRTDGLVFPGLIDLHNHIAYNCLPLWTSPTRATPWTSRSQWPDDHDYKPSIGLPANALCHADGKAVLKYVETKAVIGGVTAIQGSAKVKTPFEGWMVRNVEFETFQTGEKTVNQSVREITDEQGYADAKRHLAEGHAFLYHLSEGTDPRLIKDYDGLAAHKVPAPKFLGIHSTALGREEFGDWHVRGGSIVWSPFSNLWLYGATTDVAAADRAGMRICLGADWSPSGSKSLLGELKVADLYNKVALDGRFSDRKLCAMATSNPADALGWSDKLGRLKRDARADFVIVVKQDGKSSYRSLIEATEADVLLVAINGYPMYGTAALMAAGAAVNPEPIEPAPGLERMITLRDARVPDADLTWEQIVTQLEDARTDPGAVKSRAFTRDLERVPVELVPDKPWDDPDENPQLTRAFRGAGDGAAVVIPELDTLTPDAAYFDAIRANPFHGGLLDGLAAYYPQAVPVP